MWKCYEANSSSAWDVRTHLSNISSWSFLPRKLFTHLHFQVFTRVNCYTNTHTNPINPRVCPSISFITILTEEQNYCSYSVVQYFAVSHQRLPMRQWSNNCASLCWARGNQGEIYEHNNESYARFNYNDPGLFEVCCCSWKPFALCLSPLHWTDKHESSIKFAC